MPYLNALPLPASSPPRPQPSDRFRWNLLKAFTPLRDFLRSEWWPERINFQ